MKSLKKNLIGYGVTLTVGIFILAFLYISNFEVGININMMFGMSWGLMGAGLGGVVVSMIAMKNPSKAEEIEINEKDERNVFIREKTNSKVYSIFIYVECIVVFITAISGNRNITLLLSFVLLVKLVVWFITANNVSKNC